MALSERVLKRERTRADAVRNRRARLVHKVEPAPREPRVKRRRKQRPRRRYDLQLPVERGAEARLPAIPTLRIGVRMLSVVLLVGTLWALGSVVADAGFQVEQVDVSGNKLLGYSQVSSIAQVVGQSVFRVDPEEVIERLVRHAEVATATVQLGWPNRVEIQIEERMPIVAWNDAGRVWWLSEDGVAFVQYGDLPGLVRVETTEPMLAISEEELQPVVSPDLLKAAVSLSEHLPEVEALRYDREHGLGFEDPSGRMVYFGQEGDMRLKVQIYRELAKRLSDTRINATMVNLEDLATPYYRVER